MFQINELGPVMEDIIDLRFTAKNHNTRSETVRVGFFVESQEGTIYSSYEAPEMKDGKVGDAVEIMNGIRDQIMGLPGMHHFINAANPDGSLPHPCGS